MGCDIHMYVEKKIGTNNNESWFCIDDWGLNPYYNGGSEQDKFEHRPVYRYRNYRLFSILADVRNYSENGCIDEPRGLPDDVSDVVKEANNEWGCDGHTHSYFLLSELLEYQKENPVCKCSGMVSPEQAVDLDEKNIKPDSWCLSTTNKTHVYREWEIESPLNYLIDVVIEFLVRTWTIYRKEDVSKIADRIRLVFWFDN
jgi:hypothetical protein